MGTNSIHARSALFGALAVTLVFLVSGQIQAKPGPAAHAMPRAGWPPPPSRMVSFTVPQTTVAGGASLELFVVPPGSWLVVTDVMVNTTNFDLAEELGGAVRTVINNHAISSSSYGVESSLGYAFQPGSRVLAVNRQPYSSVPLAVYQFSGYLVDA